MFVATAKISPNRNRVNAPSWFALQYNFSTDSPCSPRCLTTSDGLESSNSGPVGRHFRFPYYRSDRTLLREAIVNRNCEHGKTSGRFWRVGKGLSPDEKLCPAYGDCFQTSGKVICNCNIAKKKWPRGNRTGGPLIDLEDLKLMHRSCMNSGVIRCIVFL